MLDVAGCVPGFTNRLALQKASARRSRQSALNLSFMVQVMSLLPHTLHLMVWPSIPLSVMSSAGLQQIGHFITDS